MRSSSATSHPTGHVRGRGRRTLPRSVGVFGKHAPEIPPHADGQPPGACRSVYQRVVRVFANGVVVDHAQTQGGVLTGARVFEHFNIADRVARGQDGPSPDPMLNGSYLRFAFTWFA